MTVSVYLDTNALVKLYLPYETGTPRVLGLLEATDSVSSSVITYPEARGVFARALARGEMTQQEYTDRLAAFEADWLTVAQIELTEAVYRRAGDLMAAHPRLRCMDAIHLASALEARLDVEIRFLTFDTDMEDVARQLLAPGELG